MPGQPTPRRGVFHTYNIPEVVCAQKSWRFARTGDQMGQGQAGQSSDTGLVKSKNVVLMPSGVWMVQPHSRENLVRNLVDAAFIDSSQVSLAPNFVQKYTFRTPTDADLPGIGTSTDVLVPGSTVPNGAPAFLRRVPHGSSWNTSTPSGIPLQDLTEFLGGMMFPTDHVIDGTVIYPENSGFGITFTVPNDRHGKQVILQFYFGGYKDHTPLDVPLAGRYCLAVLANGTLILSEYDGTAYQIRKQFSWGTPHLHPGNVYDVQIIPTGQDDIVFRITDTFFDNQGFQPSGQGLVGTLAFIISAASTLGRDKKEDRYTNNPSDTGYANLNYATGSGIIGVDLERSHRELFTLYRVKYFQTGTGVDGTVVDAPFVLPFPVPAGTPLALEVDGFTPPDTAFQGYIRDSTTGDVLSTDSDGNFLSNDGQQAYFVSIDLQCSPDGFFSPSIQGYGVAHDAVYVTRSNVSFSGGRVTQISAVGSDITPDHEQCYLHVDDVKGQLAGLLQRDRLRSIIGIRDLNTSEISIIHEGETLEVDGIQKGTVGFTGGAGNIPTDLWVEYPNVRAIGMYRRMMDGHVYELESFVQDPLAPIDPFTNQKKDLRWKVTDVIRYCLIKAGAPPDEVSIPDLDIRLWPGDGMGNDDYTLSPGTESGYMRLAMKLTKDYLGAILLRDPNAGPRGLWKPVYLPQPPFEGLTGFLWNWQFERSLGSGHYGTSPQTWGSPVGVGAFAPLVTMMVKRDSYVERVKAPECNVIVVQGMTPSGRLIRSTLINYDSINNPSSPDFISAGVREYVRPVDPGLPSQLACNWIARRIYDTAAHTQTWFNLVSTLGVVADPNDPDQVNPRCARIGDLGYVNGNPCLVRNGNPQIRVTSKDQEIAVEGVLLPVGVG